MANVKTRIIQKHDSSANWAKATTFVPLKGEIIIYDDWKKIKIGDGATKVNDLPFTNADAVKQVKLNNVAKTPNADGVVDLGTVITAHQDISGKQDKLSTAQLNAANSGITSAKVKQYDGYNTTINNHTTRLTTLEGKPGLDKTGTVSSIKINGTSKTPTNGAVDLGTVITSHQDISSKQDKLSAAQLSAANSGITSDKVKQYDGYNSTIGNHTTRIASLEGKPGLDKVGTVVKVNNTAPDASGNVSIAIPPAVSEATVSGWGFTKNTGTYSKPSGGIPKTDLASAVQTSLNNADSAVKKVKINGAEKAPTSGVVDLGTVITAHQDISGKVNTSTTIAGKPLTGNISAADLRTALNVADGANKTVVDDAFSSTSTNPIQNKLITGMFNNFVGIKLTGPDLSQLMSGVACSIDATIYTKLIELHHTYMRECAPCNIYIYYDDNVFAFAGFNGEYFSFILTTTRGTTNLRILCIYDSNTAVVVSLKKQNDNTYVSLTKDQTITGVKTFSKTDNTALIKIINWSGDTQNQEELEILSYGLKYSYNNNGNLSEKLLFPEKGTTSGNVLTLATTDDVKGEYEVFKRTNMNSSSFSTNWTIKSDTTLPEGAKLIIQITSGSYSQYADNMENRSVFIWNIPIGWNTNQTTESFTTETSTVTPNNSWGIDGAVGIYFAVYAGKTNIYVRGRNNNSTPGKVEFWTYK